MIEVSPTLLDISMFNTATAFIPTGQPGNKSRGPNGDLDNDTLTNYEEYSYNMPSSYSEWNEYIINIPAGGGTSKIQGILRVRLLEEKSAGQNSERILRADLPKEGRGSTVTPVRVSPLHD